VTTELRDVPFTPVDEALERLERVVSPLSGIVTHVVHAMHATDDCSLVQTSCHVAPTDRLLGSSTPEYSGGAHPLASHSRAAAIGEAVERYCGTYVPEESLVLSTAAALGAAVPPERFALFHPAQTAAPGFPFDAYRPDTPLRFVRALSLVDDGVAFLPAQLVYLAPPGSDETAIAYATSNGLASGASFEEAVLRALLELVERDAVMLAWKNRLSLPLLEWDGDSELVALDDRHFRRTRLRYSVLDASVFLGVPVAIAVVHGLPGEQTALALGGGAAATIAEAWRKALAEAFSVHRWLGRETLRDPTAGRLVAEAVRTFDDHMLFYARHERARLAGFLDASEDRTPVSSIAPLAGPTPRAQVAEIASLLARQGVSAYATDVTTPEIRELGLHVARVVAPELCPLDVVHRARFLGGRRLYHAAHETGLTPAPLTPSDLNALPHPFP
jgi:ribosomal protein S12 methylthiotransferase accessory factor